MTNSIVKYVTINVEDKTFPFVAVETYALFLVDGRTLYIITAEHLS